jgi:hypothetical protein
LGRKKKKQLIHNNTNLNFSLMIKERTACAFDIRLYLIPLGQARQFIETCGT